MNKKLCILLVLAVICSTVFAGKSKEKVKDKSNESKGKSNESKSKEDSDESSSVEVLVPSTTTVGEITNETTETPTEPATEATTQATTELATENENVGAELTANEVKTLCKGVIVDMKPYPGNCNKFVICVLGKATIQSCGTFQVFNNDIKFCTFGDPKKC